MWVHKSFEFLSWWERIDAGEANVPSTMTKRSAAWALGEAWRKIEFPRDLLGCGGMQRSQELRDLGQLGSAQRRC